MAYKLVFHHFHNTNDPGKKIRKKHKYATSAALVNTDQGTVEFEAWAYCGKRDVPTRALGRAISLGRLLNNLPSSFDKNSIVNKFAL